MSSKKSFSIPQGLASGIRTSIQSATTNHGQLHYDMMSIEVLETDPKNPRKLAITKEEILAGGVHKSDPHYARKIQELEALSDLAESIKKVGIRNAIEVYKDANKYRIISGERRYLAALLAGQKYVPARINQKLDELKLRYIQWVENINRQDLSLWERYNNLSSMAEAYYRSTQGELDSISLKNLLGVSDTQSYRYLCLLKADPELIELMRSEKLTNLKLVQELVSIKNKVARQKIIQDLMDAKENTTSLQQFKKLKAKKSILRTPINLGKINHPATAQFLIRTLLNDAALNKYRSKFAAIDWGSIKAINKAFQDLLKVIEKELSAKETANEN